MVPMLPDLLQCLGAAWRIFANYCSKTLKPHSFHGGDMHRLQIMVATCCVLSSFAWGWLPKGNLFEYMCGQEIESETVDMILSEPLDYVRRWLQIPVDGTGNLPLHICIHHGSLVLLETLLLILDSRERKNLLLRKNNFGQTPIMMSASFNYNKVVQCLLKTGALTAVINNKGYNSLHRAVAHRNLDVLRYLLEQGANPNVAAYNGITPLHIASINNELKAVQLLLAYGASITAQSCIEYTALDYAYESNNLPIIKCLEAHHSHQEIVRLRIMHKRQFSALPVPRLQDLAGLAIWRSTGNVDRLRQTLELAQMSVQVTAYLLTLLSFTWLISNK